MFGKYSYFNSEFYFWMPYCLFYTWDDLHFSVLCSSGEKWLRYSTRSQHEQNKRLFYLVEEKISSAP